MRRAVSVLPFGQSDHDPVAVGGALDIGNGKVLPERGIERHDVDVLPLGKQRADDVPRRALVNPDHLAARFVASGMVLAHRDGVAGKCRPLICILDPDRRPGLGIDDIARAAAHDGQASGGHVIRLPHRIASRRDLADHPVASEIQQQTLKPLQLLAVKSECLGDLASPPRLGWLAREEILDRSPIFVNGHTILHEWEPVYRKSRQLPASFYRAGNSSCALAWGLR